MKKFGIFICGFFLGSVITVLVLAVIGFATQSPEISGVRNLEKAVSIEHYGSFEVLQVIAENAALVNGKQSASSSMHLGMVYLLRNYEGKYYYDEEIIKVPKGKKVVQTGTYQYDTKSGLQKTVPIIEIVNK